ncbi:MAG: hypothetical protein AAGA71_14400 [Pseudomonadota bacterium]
MADQTLPCPPAPRSLFAGVHAAFATVLAFATRPQDPRGVATLPDHIRDDLGLPRGDRPTTHLSSNSRDAMAALEIAALKGRSG